MENCQKFSESKLFDQPSIDIIIPAYNPGSFFQGCLESCFTQSFTGNYSIIVVDDGSSEDLLKIIHDFHQCSDRISLRYLRLDKNHGVAHARNIGILNTSAEIIFFHDADDYMCKNRLEISIRAFAQDPSLVFLCGNWRWIIGGIIEDAPRYRKPHELELKTLLFDFPISTPTVALKRKILKKTGLFNEGYKIAEDYDLWARVLGHFPNQAKYIHEELVFHNRHATPYSLSKNYMWTPLYRQIVDEMKSKYKLI